MSPRHQQAQDTAAHETPQDTATRGRAVRRAAALVAGAAIQYLVDPVSGRTRRARLADQARAAVRRPARQATDQAGKKLQVARDKAVGTVRGAVSRSTPSPNDQTLADKVRSEVLGSAEFRDRTILVDCADGKVTLRGHVGQPEQIEALEAAVRAVDGVEEVTNLVHLPGTEPANTREPVEASRKGRGAKPS